MTTGGPDDVLSLRHRADAAEARVDRLEWALSELLGILSKMGVGGAAERQRLEAAQRVVNGEPIPEPPSWQ